MTTLFGLFARVTRQTAYQLWLWRVANLAWDSEPYWLAQASALGEHVIDGHELLTFLMEQHYAKKQQS